MAHLDPKLRNRIDEKWKALNALRPLPPASVAKLREQFNIEMTYNSNAIEGNSLTLKETFLVIHEGITVKGKPLKDHLEAKDHHEALNYLYECVERGRHHTLSEAFIRNMQKLIVSDTDPEWAGKYRMGNVIITGSDHSPPDAIEIPSRMHALIEWTKAKRRKLHLIELSAVLHHTLVFIHPFYDGNGRTVRLVMNLMLLQQGYPLVVILRNDRKKYYRTLSAADHGDYKPFVRFVAQSVERSLNLYLKTLLPRPAADMRFRPLSDIARRTRYSEKYLNLLARQGKIEAHKEKRNWLTSVHAVQEYIKQRKRNR